MPLILEADRPRATLRDGDLYSPENIAAQEGREIEASTQLGRGWTSAGLSEDANGLLAKARAAYAAGDTRGGQVLEQQGRDVLSRAQQWAPTVQNLTDVTGLRSGFDWASGALGGVRSSVAPFLGGVAGAGLGAVAAPFTGGVVNPMVGARIGSALAGGASEYDEAVAGAMMDPTIRATRTMDEIGNAGLVKGGLNSVLEAAVPFGLTKSLVVGGGKKAAEALAEKKLGSYVAGNVAKDMATEGATETAQSLVGQGTQNQLLDKNIADFDYKQALNEGAAGAVAGGGMGLIGAGADVGHAKLDGAKEVVSDIKEDPFGKVLDAGVNLAGKAGQKITELEHYLDNREQLKSGKTQDEIDRDTYEKIMGKPFTSAADPSGVEESHLPASELVAKRKEQARAEGWDGTGDWLAFSRKQKDDRDTQASVADTDEFLSALAGKKSKSSLMRPTLTDDFGEQEGRDMTDDRVTDDFGTQRRGTVPYEKTSTKFTVAPGVSHAIEGVREPAGKPIDLTGKVSAANTNGRDPAKKAMTPAEREQTAALKSKLPQGPERNFGSGEAKAPAAEQAGRLAQVLVNSGYKENLIKAATTTNARDQDIRKVAGILNWGEAWNFHEGHTEKQTDSIRALAKQFGGKAAPLFRKAYDAGVSEGLFPRNDEVAERIESELVKEHKSSKMLADLLVANLRPTARAELERHGVQGSAGYNNAMSKLISEVRRVVNTGAKGNELTQTGNVKNNKTGLRNKNDDMVMRTLFGTDEKNVSAILKGFYSEQLARYNGGAKAEVDEATSSGIKGVDDLTSEEMVPGRTNYEEALGESGNEARTVETRTYHGEFHNINKADGSAALENAEGELKGVHGKVHRVGMKTALLDQYATARDTKAEDLSPQQRTKALEDAVLDYWPNLADQKPGGIQPTANDATKRDYKERSEKWQKTVEKYANILERNMQTLMTTSEEQTDAMPNEFDMVAIKALRLDRDLDHPNNSPEMGTLAFKLKTGGTFITSAPMLMRKMFRVNDDLGDTGSYHADLKGGRVQNASSILMEGITSMLDRDDYFTGEFGYVKGGEFVAVADKARTAKNGKAFKEDMSFPANFRVTGSKENDNLVTWGDSQQAAKDARAGLQSRNEEVRETGLQKVDATAFDKVEALKAALRTDGVADKIDTEKLTRFLKDYNAAFFAKFKDTEQGKAVIKAKEAARAASRSAKEIHKLAAEITKLKEVSNWNYQRDQARAEAKAAEPRIKQAKLDEIFGAQQTKFDGLLNDWVAFTFPKGLTVTDMIPGKPDTGTQVDGLQADNPAGEIVRDKDGRVQTSNLEMAAQTGFGKSNVGTAPVPTRERGEKLAPDTRINSEPVKADPARENKPVVAWDQTEARNWAAGVLNKGIPAFHKAIEKHAGNADANARIDAGLFHLSRMGVVGVQDIVPDATKEQAAKIIARAKSIIGDKNVEMGLHDQAGATGVRPTADQQGPSAETNVGTERESKQKATDTVASDADQQAAVDHIVKTLGDSVEKGFVDKFADGASGKWTPQATKNLIQIALNGDVLSTAFHESFHEFMDILEKHGGGKTLSQIERVAMMPMMQTKLDRLLDGHPEAQAQLKRPDEAAAFMYQFWMAGKLNIGPETKTIFQKFADMIKSVLGLVSKEVRNMHLDEIQTEKLLKAFSNGAMVNTAERQAVVDAMNASVEANEAAQVRVGKAQQLLNDTAGKLMFSAEAMLDATDNKYMGMGSAIFHQKAGTAMKAQTLMDATRQQTSVYMNKLENTLMKYEQADLEMARHGLSVGKRPTAKVAGEAYDALKGYFKEMADYLDKKEVKRLDIINGKPTWVKIDFRKDYWPQVWDMDFLEKNVDAFRQDLIDNHSDILAKIAADANAEVKARKGAGENTASQVQLDAGKTETITPAMIADSLIVRLMHTSGQIDIEEDLNDLGITPMAAAVNRRKLDWLDAEKFDKYKSKDISKIMTTYTVNMVKRAEYQDRLGPGGERLRDINDKAILFEMAGKKDGLVRDAERELPAAIESWGKAAAAWHEANPGGEKFPEPYPTLRSVGAGLHRAKVGNEKASADNKAALKHLEQGFKAFQAMEGTLGRDISPNFRQFSSWMVTYQNFTKLSTMLFTSFQDVMGIVANGGEMNDAWNAFVSGIKEIKNSWTDKKDTGLMMSRAELWGAVDAGSFADAVGQAYGSQFMSANARRLSDKFFKYTGAEGWNRGVRGVASQVAERTILEWKQHGVDAKDPAAKARVERLFGKGFDVANIKLDADGNLDITDEKNQAAVTRWVLDAVPTTSAAHRPIWGSDPHYQMFIQFKNYTYSFHRILLKGAVEQAKLGNYRPALVLALGYMPIAIAGGAIKEMLIPGEEPPWMKGGLDGYLSYGFSKAGVLGVPQMYAQNLYDLDPAATFGPTIDQIQNVMSIPLFEQRTLLGEGLGALPGGNLLRRAA